MSQESVPLVDPQQERGGWQFDNGREFPGATGSLQLGSEKHRGNAVLKLRGDFSNGGNYVQAAADLPSQPADTLTFWLKAPAGADLLPIRLIDGSKQCHQLRLKIADHGRWQHIAFPVEEYFAKMGTAAALDVVAQYQQWGGANDSRWHQPGRAMVFMFTRAAAVEGGFEFSDVRLVPAPETSEIRRTVPLDEQLQAGQMAWNLNLGLEFKGAQGELSIAKDGITPNRKALHLQADFRDGGAYVGMNRRFDAAGKNELHAVRFKLRSNNATSYGLRLIDATGQVHQRRNLPLKADGQWHKVEINPQEFAGAEHWSGANDGRWHGGLNLIDFLLNTRSADSKQPELYMSNLEADITVVARVAQAAFDEDFEHPQALSPDHWRTAGDIQVAPLEGATAKHAVLLQRTLENVRTETAATSRPFGVRPGLWQIEYRWKSDLHSPDNSYHGSLVLALHDTNGRHVGSLPLGIGHGKAEWQKASATVEIPKEATTARVQIELHKTYGAFYVDSIAARRLDLQPLWRRIDRILIGSTERGNLFFPNKPGEFQITVEASMPLSAEQQAIDYSIVDYWGGRHVAPGGAKLVRQESSQSPLKYSANIALPADSLKVGKFYELHVVVPRNSGDAATQFSGFAILPEAETKQYDPLRSPFTIRNWDSRIGDYFYLADRIGLRQLGIWGGWSADPPYKPHAPGIDLCKQLGAKWVTGTPASSVEREGFKKYNAESLAAGMTNFLKAYADKGLAMIALGNEPHGTGKKVLDNVQAYKAIYQAVKKFDPKIHVIGTSVEPNKEYFQAGYHKYLDSYDFHIYESYQKVRDTMAEYRELMQHFDAVKPIHSTELGLNSQGQTRQAVARELIKKCTVFFAEGGATVSWFTIMYPDPQGRARGQFGDAHCVFDCQYNKYNPRLDAVTYYHLVNSVGVKKFAAERQYDGGVQAFLFSDDAGNCLQVLWCDEQRRDVRIPLPDQTGVEITYLDGEQTQLTSDSAGVTVTVSADPVLLQYRDAAPKLADGLGRPLAHLVASPDAVRPGDAVTFQIASQDLDPAVLHVEAPQAWKILTRPNKTGQAQIQVEAPADTMAQQARLRIQLGAEDRLSGELTVDLQVAKDLPPASK